MQFGGNYPILWTETSCSSWKTTRAICFRSIRPDEFDQSVLETGLDERPSLRRLPGHEHPGATYNKTMLENAGAELPENNMTWDEAH